jgi:RNA recognition motif-containing protein
MGRKLFVGNLSFDVSEVQLRALFEADGLPVEDVNVVRDRETGRPRGFAFVEFATDDAARTAIEKFNGTDLAGRPIRLDEARERAPRRGPGGGGGGGRGGRPRRS